jgi:hypothetical protein
MTENETFEGRAEMAREELRERIQSDPDLLDGEPHDVIFEIADGCVPVYTYDRFQVVASSGEVWGRELELAEPTTDMVGLAGIAIFEALEDALWAEWQRIQDEREEDSEE